MRQDCKNFESRTYANGETVRKCNLDLAPDAPWRCPDKCPAFEPRMDAGWTYGSMVAPPTPPEPPGLDDGSAAAILDEAGVQNYAVNAGGDMRLAGRAVPDLCWRVGIQHPLERDQIAAVVEAGDLAVATSGAYARGDHVFDPHTHRPPEGVLSVTVVGPDLATADAYATAAFAMGPHAGPHWTARLRGYEAMTVLANETVLSTGAFPAA